MGGFNAIETFSYNMRDREVIVKAQKIAEQLDMSFSAYVVKCLKAINDEGGSQKKEEGTNRSPIPMISSKEENEEVEYIPTIESERVDIYNFVKSRTDTRELGKIEGNGKFMTSLAKRKIYEIKVSASL